MLPAGTRASMTVVLTIAIIFLLYQVVLFFSQSWMAFCVYYTASDLYKKRRAFLKHTKLIWRLLGFGKTQTPPNSKPRKKPNFSLVEI